MPTLTEQERRLLSGGKPLRPQQSPSKPPAPIPAPPPPKVTPVPPQERGQVPPTNRLRERQRLREALLPKKIAQAKFLQEQVLTELPRVSRQTLKLAGFTTRLRPTRAPDKASFRQKFSGGWPWPGAPVTAGVTQTPPQTNIVYTPAARLSFAKTSQRELRPGEATTNEAMKRVLRHEIGHQLLTQAGIKTEQHHTISQLESRPSRKSIQRLATLINEFTKGTTKLRKFSSPIGRSTRFFDRPGQ
jgi:hypothetical protein